MDFNKIWQTLYDKWVGIEIALPNIIGAILVFLAFYFVARKIRTLVVQMTDKRERAKNLGLILGRLTQSSVIVIGALVSLTIVFPSFQPGELIQLLGIGSVAIGFAFHDIFQNFLAGILILLTSPFRIGDQIAVAGFEGTVEDIKTRATSIKTYDGRRIVIPNSDLFTNSVTVNTAFSRRRLEYEVAVSFENDIDEVKKLLLSALNAIDGVLDDPPAEALVVALSDVSINIRVYWWTKMPRHTNILHLQDKVLTTLKNKLVTHNIELPTQTQRILLQSLPDKDEKILVDGHNHPDETGKRGAGSPLPDENEKVLVDGHNHPDKTGKRGAGSSLPGSGVSPAAFFSSSQAAKGGEQKEF